jgi:poly-gamma-glutamate capsule biosynthesis protein CapA/YwtB (metallophosphatase superfamily)
MCHCSDRGRLCDPRTICEVLPFVQDDIGVKLFLCGDVMTGRGIDQVLPHPVNPVLYEPYIRDARAYVDLAETVNGPIQRPVSFDYIWGEALQELEQSAVDVRIVNLETSVTTADTPWRDKEIHYRMHPQNIGCVTAARIDACALANNHILDWNYDGLSETLRTLDAAHIVHAGAGNNAREAAAPAVLNVAGRGRVLFFSFASTTSGVFEEWRATDNRAGLNLLDDLSEETAARIADAMRQSASDQEESGDVLIASIHWGSNWGYEISPQQIAFAHRLIEEGISIVYGHSSHHIKTIEVFKDRLVLYGCGDFITDYEGISGYERFRGDLGLMYLVDVDPRSGQLVSARLVPMRMRRFRLERVPVSEAKWLCNLLNELGKPFTTQMRLSDDNSLTL